MVKGLSIIVIALCCAAVAFGQDSTIHGVVNYIAGDAIYLSLGRNAGVKDSTVFSVIERSDTIARLKVYATSSKSAVSRMLDGKRAPVIGDSVSATVQRAKTETAPLIPVTNQAATQTGPGGAPGETTDVVLRMPQPPPFLRMQGRINLQYFRTGFSDADITYTQPGIVAALRGQLADVPLNFDVYANLRTVSTGAPLFMSSDRADRSRMYRLSIGYDDSTTMVSAGRIIPSSAPLVGYVDGVMLARRSGDLVVGSVFGYEPGFSQRTFSTDLRKFALFGSYLSRDPSNMSLSLSYARRYYVADLDREAISAMVTAAPGGDFFLAANGDFDLRGKSGSALLLAPRITNLFSNLTYRPLRALSVGAGVSAWRANYAFYTVKNFPDSLLDQELRTTPSMDVTIVLPANISLYDAYSPRASAENFGHEYLNVASATASNLFGQGVTLRGGLSINATSFTTVRGYSASLQGSPGGFGDATLRYQSYQYEVNRTNQTQTSQTVALDVLFPLPWRASVWGSIERMLGLGAGGYMVSIDLGWRI